jgi:hypothetical protein
MIAEMGMQVDEPRRDNEPVCVDFGSRSGAVKIPKRYYPFALDPDVSALW